MTLQNLDFTVKESRRSTNREINESYLYYVPEKIRWNYMWIISPVPEHRENGLGYIAVIEFDEKGGFTATIPTLPGCITEGETLEETTLYLQDALEGWFKVAQDRNLEIPDPDGPFMQ